MNSASIQTIGLRMSTADIDEYQEVLKNHHAPIYAEPLNRGNFKIEADAVLFGGINLSTASCTTGVSIVFEKPFDGYGLSIPNKGCFKAFSGGREFSSSATQGLMLDSSIIDRAVIGSDTTLPRIAISTEAMHRRLSSILDQPITKRIQFEALLPQSNSIVPSISSISRIIYDGLHGTTSLLQYPTALTSLHEALLSLILEGIPSNYHSKMVSKAPTPSPGNIKRAIDYIHTHAAFPMKIEDVANAAGTSVRSLQSGFIKFKGLSPMSYLRNVRLSGARGELLIASPGVTISTVALAWGFPNLSSFSTLYTRAFGEKPSMTLSKSRAR